MEKKYILIRVFLVFFLFAVSHTASAQFYRKHFIAPTTWDYFKDGNEFVIATQSPTNVTVAITKSDGTPLQTLMVVKGNPVIYRPTGAINSPRLPFNTVLNDAGVIITASQAVSVEQRNVIGDRTGTGVGTIKGNALMVSFGNAGLGKNFRIGYYRDDAVIDQPAETPTYSVMATSNNTAISLNGVPLTTLNSGQSYLFKAPIGSLVTASEFVVMNVSANVDAPAGCGDGAADQLPPLSSLGVRYMMVRGRGNSTAEQIITVAATPNTVLTLKHYNAAGDLVNTETRTLDAAGDYTKFSTGGAPDAVAGSVTEIVATSNVAVYAGTGQGCEVDVVTGLPVSLCSGSFDVGSTRFMLHVAPGSAERQLPYYGYLYLNSSRDIVTLNGRNLEEMAGPRKQLGTSGVYLIDFENIDIGAPEKFDISCNSKFNLELVQSGSGFGMASFFSGIADIPETPDLVYNATENCVNTTATLTGDTGYAFYQWFLDGVEIPGAVSHEHVATRTGTYEMGAFLRCGQLVKSLPVDVVLCADVSVATTVDNATPDMGSDIVFTVKASNEGNNSAGVSVTDLLSDGFTFVAATAPRGTSYDNATGLWNIGAMEAGESLELKITATVKTSGSYENRAEITSSAQPDPTPSNNISIVTVVPQRVTVGCEAVPTAQPSVQPTCSQSGTIEINTPLGSQYEYKLNNGSYQASPLFENVGSGTYTVTVRRAATPDCVSHPATVVVDPIAGLPVAPSVTTVQPTCLSATGSITVTAPTGAVEYSIDGTNYQVSNVFSDVVSGTYTISARNTNDLACISTTTGITIDPAPLLPSVPVATAAVDLGCNALTAEWNASSNARNYYIDVSTESTFSTFVSGYNNFNVGNVVAYRISGLETGRTYYYRVRSSNGICTSASSNAITTATSPVTPQIPVSSAATNLSCSSINANWANVNNAFGYFLDVSTVDTFASFVSGYNSLDVGDVLTYPVTGLNEGTTYYYRVRAYNGCGTSGASAIMQARTGVQPNVPVVGAVTQPNCTALGTVALSGLPAGDWIINVLGDSGLQIEGSGTSTVIRNVPEGSYNIAVTNDAGCTSSASSTILINAQPPTPTAPVIEEIIQPTCILSTGSVTLSGLPPGDWIINPGAIQGTGTEQTISGLTAGTYSFTVTNDTGCVSAVSADVVIDAQPSTPTAPVIGAITDPTCSTLGTVELSGLPSGNWVLHRTGTSNVIIPGNGESVSDSMLPGTYRYFVVNDQGCHSVVSAEVVINDIPALPGEPGLGAVVHPDCFSATGSVTFVNLPAGDWKITQSGPVDAVIESSGSTYTAENLIAGDYYFELNSFAFCTANSGHITINAQPQTPTQPIVTVTQPTCTEKGIVELSGLPSGDWTLNLSGAGNASVEGSGSSYRFDQIDTAGTYSVSVTNEQGCTSAQTTGIVIDAQPVTPSIPVVDQVIQPTCTDLGIIRLSGLPSGDWILRPAGRSGREIEGSGPTAEIRDLVAGYYNATVTNDVGCTSDATHTVEIFTQPPTPAAPIIGAVTQPGCGESTGSVELTGLPFGSWTIEPGNIEGIGSRYTVTGLVPGTYEFMVSSSGCVSAASVQTVIDPQPATPSTPIVDQVIQPTCTDLGIIRVSGLPSGNWTLRLVGTGMEIQGSDPTAEIRDLPAGHYSTTVTNDAGCTSAASSTILINAKPPTPTAPVIEEIIQPTCRLSTGSVTLSGLPSGDWTINPGAIQGTGTEHTISGLTAGTYSFTVTNDTGCVSAVSADVVIDAQPSTPTAPVIGAITDPTCSTPGTVELSGLPSGNWVLHRTGTSNVIIPGNGESVSDSMLPGTYRYFVVNDQGCHSVVTADVVINDIPALPGEPALGAVVHPDCFSATGSVTFVNLPAGDWKITQSGPLNAVIESSGSTYTAENLIAGDYYFELNSFAFCTANSGHITINAQPQTPPQPRVTVTQPTCTEKGIVELSGLPSGDWILNLSGAGNASVEGSGSSYRFDQIGTAGTYSVSVTNEQGCTSAQVTGIVIDAQPVTPSIPVVDQVIQPTCTDLGIIRLSGLPSGDWILRPAGGSGRQIEGSGPTAEIRDLVAGYYNATVTNDVGCTSDATHTVEIFTPAVIPSIPIVDQVIQPTCTDQGIIRLSGLPFGDWILRPVGGIGMEIRGSGPTAEIRDLPAGHYSATVTNEAGCTSDATHMVEIFTQPATPAAPIIGAVTHPGCGQSTGSVELTGLPFGNWIIQPGNIEGIGNRYRVTGLVPGTYEFTVTSSSGCVSAASAQTVINVQPVTPSAPVVGLITDPTCNSGGKVQLSGLPSGDWVLYTTGGGTGVFPGSGPSIEIEGLMPGTYRYTVVNSQGCESAESQDVVITDIPALPGEPVLDAVTHPDCLSATGSVTFVNLPSGSWTITQVGPMNDVIVSSGSSYTISGLIAGDYYFELNSLAFCTGRNGNVTINAQPPTPAVPVVNVVQPVCGAAGIVELSGLPSGDWTLHISGAASSTIKGSGPTYSFTGLTVSGTYNLSVTNDQGCSSAVVSGIVLNAQPEVPAVPIVDAIIQPTCTALGILRLSGLPSGDWILDLSGAARNRIEGSGPTAEIRDLAAGYYNVSVTNAAGCRSNATDEIAILTPPPTPAVPRVDAITQPDCTSLGTVALSGLPFGGWTLNVEGEAGLVVEGSGTIAMIADVPPGSYNITVTNEYGCTSAGSVNIIINAQPAAPAAPRVAAVTHPGCGQSTGSVELTGLPLGRWTIQPGNIEGIGESYMVTGLGAGIYEFTVTSSSGCVSAASAQAVINAQPVTPAAPVLLKITDPTCSVATGSVVLGGLPAGDWVINPGAVKGSGTQTTITGLVSGTYNFTVTNDAGCTSVATADAVIKTPLPTLAAPVIERVEQPTCSDPKWIVALSGLPMGNWIIRSGSFEFSGSGATALISGSAPGLYRFTVTDESGCSSPPAQDVVIAGKDVPGTPVVSVVDNCDGTSTLSTNAIGSILWSTNETTPVITVRTAGIYTVTVTVGGCSSPLGSGTAKPGTAPDAPEVTVGKGTLTITGLQDHTYSVDNGEYSDRLVYTDLEAGTHTVTAKNQFGCISSTLTVEIEAIPSGFKIYNAVSPNGDGKNDYFYIQGIENYPDNRVQIFNRYGVSVFKGAHYDNQNVRFTGEKLASGTYFYTIEYKDENSRPHNFSGYLFIN